MPQTLLVNLRDSLICFFLTLSLFVLLIVKPIHAVELWTDEFDSVDSTRWTVLNETDTAVIFTSEALFRNIDATKSLFFQTNTSLPGGDIIVEVKFRYFSGSFGSGIAVNDNPVALRSLVHPSGSDWTVFVWPTSSDTFKVFSPICPVTGSCIADNVFATVNGVSFSNSHVLKIGRW